jgi:hypothetical protein
VAHLWLCLGQQGPRHPRPASLPRPPQHSAYRPVHRAIPDAVQGFLAGLRTRAESRMRAESGLLAHRVISLLCKICPLLDQSGQRWIFGRDGLSANAISLSAVFILLRHDKWGSSRRPSEPARASARAQTASYEKAAHYQQIFSLAGGGRSRSRTRLHSQIPC